MNTLFGESLGNIYTLLILLHNESCGDVVETLKDLIDARRVKGLPMLLHCEKLEQELRSSRREHLVTAEKLFSTEMALDDAEDRVEELEDSLNEVILALDDAEAELDEAAAKLDDIATVIEGHLERL